MSQVNIIQTSQNVTTLFATLEKKEYRITWHPVFGIWVDPLIYFVIYGLIGIVWPTEIDSIAVIF